MHRLGVGELEKLLQLESVAKASWFGHDPGDGDPSPCDDHLFAGLNLGQHGRKPGLCGSHADSLYQGDLKRWSDDQGKHRLPLLTPEAVQSNARCCLLELICTIPPCSTPPASVGW